MDLPHASAKIRAVFVPTSIHDITHSILQRPQEERKEWHTALYVAVGAVPGVEALQQSEENYVSSVLRSFARPKRARTLTARYWRASGCAAWLWMRAYDEVYGAMRLDVFCTLCGTIMCCGRTRGLRMGRALRRV